MYRPSKTRWSRPKQDKKESLLAFLIAKSDRASWHILIGPLLFVYQAFFLVQHAAHSRILPLFFSLFFCLFFGMAALFAEHWLDQLAGLLKLHLNRILSLFLLFFISLLGYLLLISLLISSPMALVLTRNTFSVASINLFVQQSSNCALALALVAWLRRLPSFLSRTDGGAVFQLRPSRQ